MKIKRFEATTEQEAIEMVKEEFGLDALVLNIKKMQPRGIFSFLRKPLVEVTAAFDENKFASDREKPIDKTKRQISSPTDTEQSEGKKFEDSMKDLTITEQKNKIKTLEDMLVSTEELLFNVEKRLKVSSHKIADRQRKYKNNIVQVFYETLINQGVKEEIAEYMLEDLDLIDEEDKIDIHLLVRIVYTHIIRIIGIPQPLQTYRATKGDPRIVAFIGSTGVGKTTTIAKLSADFILNHGLNVGLITADTYRIAAVEQLKTYADILGIEIGVVYNKQDLSDHLAHMSGINDVLMIDTAGRSHKNKENVEELKALLSDIDGCEMFLVLSLTTKYEDMIDIVNTYAEAFDFKIIFSKLDETLNLGSVVNLCYETGRKISYITFGQNVPEDIKTLQAKDVAKAILGMGDMTDND